MKHFIIEINYVVPFERISQTVDKHRLFLSTGYEKGLLLYSGPMNPKTGGIVAARAESREEIEAFFGQDPYKLEALAEYRIIEFDPVKSQEFLKSWL